MPIKIITDSTCDLPADLFVRYGIEVVSAKLTKVMTTSHPSPHDFEQAYRAYAGHFILSVHLSFSFSATYNAACQAQRQLDPQNERIKIIDSGSVSAGLGLFVLRLAHLIERTEDVDTILSQIQILKRQIRLDFILDNLQDIKKSGRLGRLPDASPIAKKLQFIPLFSCQNSQISYTNTFNFQDALEKIAFKLAQAPDTKELVIVHSCQDERYLLLMDLLKNNIKDITVHTCTLNNILQAHVGKGVLGIAY